MLASIPSTQPSQPPSTKSNSINCDSNMNLMIMVIICGILASVTWLIAYMTRWIVFVVAEGNNTIYTCESTVYPCQATRPLPMSSVPKLSNVNLCNTIPVEVVDDTHTDKEIEKEFSGLKLKRFTFCEVHVSNINLSVFSAYLLDANGIKTKEKAHDDEDSIPDYLSPIILKSTDYHHLIDKHGDKSADIYEAFFAPQSCDMDTGPMISRNHRDRSNETNTRLYFNSKDNNEVIAQQFIDQVHCFVHHTFDLWFKLRRNQTEMEDDTDEEDDAKQKPSLRPNPTIHKEVKEHQREHVPRMIQARKKKGIDDHVLIARENIDLSVGAKGILMDLGGGSADIACHVVVDKTTLNQTYHPQNSPWGSSCIDAAYARLLDGIFGTEPMVEEPVESQIAYGEIHKKIQAARLENVSLKHDVQTQRMRHKHELNQKRYRYERELQSDRRKAKELDAKIKSIKQELTLQFVTDNHASRNLTRFERFKTRNNKYKSDTRELVHTYDDGIRFFYWAHYKYNDEVYDVALRRGDVSQGSVKGFRAANDGYAVKDWYIETKYDDLKDELLNNKICTISAAETCCLTREQFDIELKKAQMHFKSNRKRKYPFLSLAHTMALMTWCDYDEWNSEVSASFRESEGIDYSSLFQFYHNISKYLNLKRAVFDHGTHSMDGKIDTFYHGISKSFVFSDAAVHISPIYSITSSFQVA
eukprot:255537_1